VHWSRTGQGRQVPAANLITIASVPRWVAGLHQVLVCPCGQVAWWASKPMVKPARSSPAPALACRDVSARQRGEQCDPHRRRLSMTSAADG